MNALTRDEFHQFCRASQSSLAEGTKEEIDSLYDEYLKFVDFLKRQQTTVDDDHEEDEDLSSCEQCGENAWDGYICHFCGAKNI